jgi:hypothetical protein
MLIFPQTYWNKQTSLRPLTLPGALRFLRCGLALAVVHAAELPKLAAILGPAT